MDVGEESGDTSSFCPFLLGILQSSKHAGVWPGNERMERSRDFLQVQVQGDDRMAREVGQHPALQSVLP